MPPRALRICSSAPWRRCKDGGGSGFIASLALGGGAHGEAAAPSAYLDAAKLGILGGSLLSGALGWVLLARTR